MKLVKQKGFTLIELMITVAIVGILSAFAIPAYQNYATRAQVSEAVSLVASLKAAVIDYQANHGVYPSSNADIGFDGATGKFVQSVNVMSDGNVVATISNKANSPIIGKYIVLTPNANGGTDITLSFLDKLFGVNSAIAGQEWACFSNADQQYLPSSCTHTTFLKPQTPDTWTGGVGAPASGWAFPISNKMSDIGMFSYTNIGGLATGTQTLTLSNGAVYTKDFIAVDGTLVFKHVSGPDNYSFLALGGIINPPFGYAGLVYQTKGSSTVNVSSTSTTPTKTVDLSAWNVKWLNSYLNSTQFASKNN
ncbi:pilin [Burkholderia cenocepacia]|uniref:pilin n=1 Tax=Burkholderia cepacia complex TaxID=87882 RepID=UPI0023EE334F|nr:MULTISPECIES: pilin [Burkholderia cepacia complex]MCO8354323.1 pilin [Burkholderia multivorans]MCO8386945.1 pilin [Burkholderia multivorans]MCO8406356.1 pilin [Burkholderia multivorans]MCO8421450.1 pilin [Burkholderia cenocepacia]MCO8435670.1 pilin [Burkholderia multivorans]